MSGALSPDGYSLQAGPSDDTGPLSSLNLDFLKNITDKKSTTKDGQPPKRRGPKPDSKPALTRRQELNRQAQRTHRERKERYIKALEDEVLRLKEAFTHASQDKDQLAEENHQLKALLNQGTAVSGPNLVDDSSLGYTSGSASINGSYAPISSNTSNFTASPLPTGTLGHHADLSPNTGVMGGFENQPIPDPNLDYEQVGIDFVLTLERPCMEHLPWLLDRTVESGRVEPCGHALMASCPPESFTRMSADVPFGHSSSTPEINSHGANMNGTGEGLRTWDLAKPDLATLMDLSQKLNLDGEITPVMAWGMVVAHPGVTKLTMEDFKRLAGELAGKVRCYGFGSVMEEFEVRDALENVLSTRTELVLGY
ncbi:hypothetical protein QBC40DRAFT_185037 [Triangularia verruculosa]|uniref:BZIP domain-containing protein n=1 Tax=Triangularia verruculosa TaxID=2587418 RepID=A0AAN6XBX2_9PEZI|nr:hypothetical protein QBC40DRAFT_185037 [Triangularia verruculosa]